MVKSIRFLKICFLLLLTSSTSFAENDSLFIQPYSDIGSTWTAENLIIPQGSSNFTLEEIISGKVDSLFKPLIQYSSIRKDSLYWIKFRVGTNSEMDHWILQMRPRFQKAEIFFIDNNGEIRTLSSGIAIKYSNWPLPGNNITFPLPNDLINPWFYLRVISDYDTGLGLITTQHNEYISEIIPQNLSYGLFYGIIAIATLFSLIFYFKLGERTYLFYSLYVLSFALFATVDWGLVLAPLSYIHAPWHRDLYTIPFACMTIFLLFYARGLLELKGNKPILDSVLLAAIATRLIVYLIGTLFNIPALYSPYVDNLLLFTAYIAGIIRLRKGYKPARYFLVGLSFLYLGLIIHSLENIGLIPYNVIPFFSMYKTGVVEMFFFSIALADRFRLLKKEQEISHKKTIEYLKENSRLQDQMIKQLNENEALKDELNRDLEKKVKERTRDLEEANNVIIEINRFLEESNRNLAGEVKKISLNRVMQKTVTFTEFKEIYPDEDSCYNFLEKLKWSTGFKCKKCGYEKYSAGNTPYSRRCSRCNYIERITSDTIFAHTKFPITKAFYLLFLVNSGKNITIESLSEMLNLRKQTVWYFRKKIIDEMKSNPRRKGSLDEGWSRWVLTSQNGNSPIKKNI
ncbi:MAG: 7TM diverse intracellular signaling domain-containing protein [Bacteroidales bacterium]